MAQEPQSFFQRVRGLFQPGATEERSAAEMEAAQSEADWQDHLAERVQDAREDAAGFVEDLRGADAAFVESALKAEGLLPDRSAWGDQERMVASIEADARTLAEARGFDMTTPEGQAQAYEAVATAYENAANEVALATMPDDPAPEGPEIAFAGEWRTDGINRESREVVVATEQGYHPGYDTSHMGGEGALSYSEVAFPTVEAAEAVAHLYYEHDYSGAGDESFRVELAEKGLLPESAHQASSDIVEEPEATQTPEASAFANIRIVGTELDEASDRVETVFNTVVQVPVQDLLQAGIIDEGWKAGDFHVSEHFYGEDNRLIELAAAQPGAPQLDPGMADGVLYSATVTNADAVHNHLAHAQCADSVKEAWSDIQAMGQGAARDQLETAFMNSTRELPPEVSEILSREAPELVAAMAEKSASAEAAEDHSL